MRIKAGAQAGYFALQHHKHVEDGYTADLRAALLGVRVTGRTKPLGRWKVAKGDYGDLNGALFIQTAGKSKRPIGSFFFTGVPAVVDVLPSEKKEAPNESTVEGGNTRPSQDAEHQQADNPFIVGRKGATQGTPTTGPDNVQVGVIDKTKTQKDSQTTATVTVGEGMVGAIPIRNQKWKKDDRYQMVVASTPKFKSGKGKAFAIGQKGLLVAGTEENSQEPLFIPFDSSLVAVNYAGNATTGTVVYDLNASSEIDEDRGARLQSLMRVVPKIKALKKFEKSFDKLLTNVLALNLSPVTGQRDSFAGVWYYGGAMMTTAGYGGPFIAGKGNDQHVYGTTGDKETVMPLHLSTGALFATALNIGIKAKGQGFGELTGRTTKSGSDQQSDRDRQNNQDNWLDNVNVADGDGPLLFEGAFHPSLRAPYSVYVHLEWDKSAEHRVLDQKMKGVWRWRAESFLYEVPAPPDTPTDGPPTDGPPYEEHPPTDTGQPTRPGELPPDQPWGFLIPGSLRVTPEGDLTGDVIGAGGAYQPGGSGVKIGLEPGVTDTGTIPQDPKDRGGDHGGASPGKGREEGWWGSVVPGMGPSDLVYERPWNEQRRFSGASNEVGFPAILFRAQLFRRGAPWMTNLMTPSLAGLRWFDNYAPVVARLEGYGAQGGTPGDDILDGAPSGDLGGDPFAYTTTRQEGSPYYGGTSNGSICLLPPEVTLADIDSDFQPSTGSPVSTTYLTIPPVSCVAFGRPDLTSGGITDGHTLMANAAGDLVVTPIGSDGVPGTPWNLSPNSMQAIFGQTANATVANTGAETSIVGTGAGAASVPADGWAVGMSVRMLLRGSISTIGPAPGLIQVKGKLAGATNLASGAVQIPANLNGAECEVEIIATCRDLSTPSAAVFAGSLTFRSIGVTGAGTAQFVIGSSNWSGTVDTTAATSIDATFQWQTANAGNTITTSVGKVDTETPG
jgi:hypothetical protein